MEKETGTWERRKHNFASAKVLMQLHEQNVNFISCVHTTYHRSTNHDDHGMGGIIVSLVTPTWSHSHTPAAPNPATYDARQHVDTDAHNLQRIWSGPTIQPCSSRRLRLRLRLQQRRPQARQPLLQLLHAGRGGQRHAEVGAGAVEALEQRLGGTPHLLRLRRLLAVRWLWL